MSISQETPRLNSIGQAVLGGISSLLINGIIHPISTMQSCAMANAAVHRMGLSQLYRGYWAICATDAAAFGAAYVTNDALSGRLSPLGASIAAGLISAPVICVGEGLARNRQVNALPYGQILERAIRPVGLVTTALREVPFTVAVFCLSPLLQRQLMHLAGGSDANTPSSVAAQAAAGILAGAVAGLATSPIELIKTRVQTSEQPLSIAQVVRSVANEGGCRRFFRGGAMRSLYVGLAAAGMNVVNNTAPYFLPEILHSEE